LGIVETGSIMIIILPMRQSESPLRGA
jgi:hypothetical protein